jgi:hypothetical protein
MNDFTQEDLDNAYRRGLDQAKVKIQRSKRLSRESKQKRNQDGREITILKKDLRNALHELEDSQHQMIRMKTSIDSLTAEKSKWLRKLKRMGDKK